MIKTVLIAVVLTGLSGAPEAGIELYQADITGQVRGTLSEGYTLKDEDQ